MDNIIADMEKLGLQFEKITCTSGGRPAACILTAFNCFAFEGCEKITCTLGELLFCIHFNFSGFGRSTCQPAPRVSECMSGGRPAALRVCWGGLRRSPAPRVRRLLLSPLAVFDCFTFHGLEKITCTSGCQPQHPPMHSHLN